MADKTIRLPVIITAALVLILLVSLILSMASGGSAELMRVAVVATKLKKAVAKNMLAKKSHQEVEAAKNKYISGLISDISISKQGVIKLETNIHIDGGQTSKVIFLYTPTIANSRVIWGSRCQTRNDKFLDQFERMKCVKW